MRTILKAIKISGILIAIAMSTTLSSCSGKLPKDKEGKFEFIKEEIRKGSNFFDDEHEVDKKNEKLVTTELENAIQSNDFEYAKKYCDLLASVNYQASEDYSGKIKVAEADILKKAIEQAIKSTDFVNAKKYCIDLESVNYTEAEEYSNKIKTAESAFYISQNSENAADHLISSISTRPTKKPSIGRESESAPAYDWQSKRHNKCIDEYLEQALKNKNDILAKKLLAEYVDELTYKTVTKKNNNGSEYKINVVTGFSENHKKEAIKKYEEAKKGW